MSLPEVRRVVTAYSTSGRSVFAQDAQVDQVAPPAGSSETLFSPLWGTDSFPAVNRLEGGGDGTACLGQAIVNPTGSTFRIIDTGPGAESPLHRTESVDYVIIIAGEIVLELEDGKETTLKAGDVVVQQGTLHRWINRTAQTARFACIALPAVPLSVPCAVLKGPTFP